MSLWWLLATSASTYELMETTCQIGKKQIHNAQNCAERVVDMAEMGASFSVKVRADSPDVLAAVLASASEIDGYHVSKTDPLMLAAIEGHHKFSESLAKSIEQGRIQGWQVGEGIGGAVGALTGGATLGSLGLVAGGVTGFSAGAFAGTAATAPHVVVLCSLLPQFCPYYAVAAAVATSAVATHGGVLGAAIGAETGFHLGIQVGSAVGSLAGGVIGQEIGGTISALEGLHNGVLFQLAPGLMLAIDYAIGDGAMKALSYDVVFQKITN